MLEEENVDPLAPFLLHVRQVHAPLPPKIGTKHRVFLQRCLSDNVGKLVRIWSMQWLSEEDLGNKMASRFANRHQSVDFCL